MGGEFCNNVIEPKPGLGDKKKRKKEGGSDKGGLKVTHFTSFGSAPALSLIFIFICTVHVKKTNVY